MIIAVPDLDGAAVEFEERHGLVSVAGGRHPGWGTANRIVPLGDAYLELVAVVDPTAAAASAFGTWVADAEPGPLGWAARTDSIEDVAARYGLEIVDGSRATPDGAILRWRLAGVERAVAEPALPFFIEWGAGTPLPGSVPVEHPAGRVELRGVTVRPGTFVSAHLQTEAGELVI